MQHMPLPPVEERLLRRSVVNLPVINPDRLRTAKDLVEKAVKLRKVFSVQGPYPVIRAALWARGWVERRLPRPSQRVPRCRDDDDDGDDSSDATDTRAEGHKGQKEEDLDDICDLMSRLVRNETTYFYWTTRRYSAEFCSLRKDQVTNHYANATFTTKVGLCMNLRNLQWFDTADPDTFFPRCYRLGAEDEKHAFIEDFRRTACTSLLQYVVERTCWDEGEADEVVPVESEGGQRRRRKHSGRRFVGPGIIDQALHVCQEFLNSLEHGDIDIATETPPSLTEQQWAEFLRDYYLVVHEGALIKGGGVYVKCCQTIITRLQEACPQLDTDGLHNIWIIKPGALSRGRGITCMNRLDEVLALVDGDPTLIKDSKWVVQKYLERPLLVYDTKFDLRQWFLVTDWNPLTVWFYRECYLRFSTQPYSTKTLDSSIHLCNNSIQKHLLPSPQRHLAVPEDNMWSCSEFREYLRGRGLGGEWAATVVPGMQRAVVHALQTAQDLVESRRASFELYGADFMLGRDLRPWLLEVNSSPTMACSTAVTTRLCPAVQLDALRVVLDHRADPSAHTGGFQLVYKQVAVEVPQYVGVNLLVEGAPIKRPRLPSHRTFVIRPQPLAKHPGEAAERTAKPSNRRPSTLAARLPPGKEDQSEAAKQRQASSASPKREGGAGRAEPQKWGQRLSLSGGRAPLVPRVYSPFPPCGTWNSRPRPRLVLGPQACGRRALPRRLPSLGAPLPAVEGVSLRPGALARGALDCTGLFFTPRPRQAPTPSRLSGADGEQM